MAQKQKILFILLFGVAILIILSLIFESITRKDDLTQGTILPTPQVNKPSVAITPYSEGNVTYETGTFSQSVDVLENRRPLSAEDEKVKQKLLAIVNNKYGVVHQTQDYIIYYVDAPDDLEVELITSDFNPAKESAHKWLRDQGFSQSGVCDFPVVYYLNFSVAQSLKGKNIVFNPLPPGC